MIVGRRLTLASLLTLIRHSSTIPPKRLTLSSMSPALKSMEYAVRGPVVQEADRISADLKKGKKPEGGFEKIIYTNIGNPHSVGQKPLTFPRQVSLEFEFSLGY